MKLKKHINYEKLSKDIYKGQSLQMLCYLYKVERQHILQYAKENNLEVFDPVSMPDKAFRHCNIGLQSSESFKLTNGWM
jgi:hypothetical protein